MLCEVGFPLVLQVSTTGRLLLGLEDVSQAVRAGADGPVPSRLRLAWERLLGVDEVELDLLFEVEATVVPEEADSGPTWSSGGTPGHPAYLDDVEVRLGGQDVTDILEGALDARIEDAYFSRF